MKPGNNYPVQLPFSLLFKEGFDQTIDTQSRFFNHPLFESQAISLDEAASRLLQLPTIGEKTFLIHICDRTVGGCVARDQMVGPWQTPVSDVAVTCSSFEGYTGEAIALGERAPIALINHAASARMAVSEAITNIACVYLEDLSLIKLSANWQVAFNHPGEAAGLYEAVQAIGIELCPELGISIPVGKDSLSMQVIWEENNQKESIVSPLALNITAFAPLKDVRKMVTPQIRLDQGPSVLLLIDLGKGQNRLGGEV